MKNKIILSLLVAIVSCSAFANDMDVPKYLMERCTYQQEKEMDNTVGEYILANNTFGDNHKVLRTAVRLTESASSRYSAWGSAELYVGKEGTVLSGLFLCSERANRLVEAYETDSFSFDKDINLNQLIKKGKAEYDLDHELYIDDEHVAVKGSILKAKVASVDDNVTSIEFNIEVRISDLTEIDDEFDDDDLPAHKYVIGKFFLNVPTMSLRVKYSSNNGASGNRAIEDKK